MKASPIWATGNAWGMPASASDNAEPNVMPLLHSSTVAGCGDEALGADRRPDRSISRVMEPTSGAWGAN